jgi:ectoine hydroxylase-related dioxygenase (phytanoyl-CoA dioxygenase family)
MHVSDSHLDEVRERGFTVVKNFLEPELLHAAREALFRIVPSPEDYFADPEPHKALVATQFSGMKFFPYNEWALDRLAVHPDLVDAAERFCGTDDLHLYKCELWSKYSGGIDYDQPHHRDFFNHTLLVPKEADDFVQMTTFILLSDVTEQDGPTKLIPLDQSADIPIMPMLTEMGQYREREVAALATAGSLMIYKTNVVHRGSNFTGVNRSRFALLIDFQRRGLPWTGKMAWPNNANTVKWTTTIAKMSVRERQLFGFPAVDDPYWDEQTIRDVGLRYPEMDMTPYSSGLGA